MDKLKSLIISRWLLVIIIIIAAFFRLYNITEIPPGFYPDEAIYANNGVEAWETNNFKIFYPENNGREGLWPNIIGFFIVKFGHEPWISRSIAAIFGILTVLGIYFLTKELFAGRLFSDGTGRPSAPAADGGLDSRQPASAFGGDQARAASETFRTKTGDPLTYSEIAALLSSFLLATSFWHILFSRIGFRAIMAPMFLTWSLYFLLKTLNQVKNKFQAPSTKSQTISNDQNFNNQNKFRILNFKNWNLFGIWNLEFGIFAILGGLLYGLGFHTYIAYRATPLLILIILTLYWIRARENTDTKLVRKKILLMASGYTLMAIIVAAPLGLYFLKNPQDFFGRTTQISVFNSSTPFKDLITNILKTAGMFNFAGDWNWRHNYAGKPELFWPVGILFLTGVFLAVKSLIQKSNIPEAVPLSAECYGAGKNQNYKSKFKNEEYDTFPFIILFAWLIITALPIVISNEGLPHALRAILMIPPVFILAGVGGLYIYNWFKNTITRDSKLKTLIFRGFIFIFLSLLIFETYNSYFIKWAKNPNTADAFNQNYVNLGRELNLLPKEMPKYVIVEAGGVDVRSIPMPAQTVMFITDTFTPEKQREKNIFYVLPKEKDKIPSNAYTMILK